MTTGRTRNQNNGLAQIQKVLELEARKGYTDASAVNGVSAFAGERIAAALATRDGADRRLVQDLDALLSGYGRLDPEERERVATESLSLLRDILLSFWPVLSRQMGLHRPRKARSICDPAFLSSGCTRQIKDAGPAVLFSQS